mmetsp:Transcript_38122/g.106104  ORF Transcript_38122/g.106104 Transcript_38122/m.106104 type:complete len:265 (+) Transcript_38122:772-1566(+)
MPALLLRGQVQHVHGHILLEPLGGILQLCLGPIVAFAGLRPVAELRLLQRPEGRDVRGGHAAQAGNCLLGLVPCVLVFQMVEAPVLLHHDPAEVAVEGVLPMVRQAGLVREHPEADVLGCRGQVPSAQGRLLLRHRGLLVANVGYQSRGDRGGCPCHRRGPDGPGRRGLRGCVANHRRGGRDLGGGGGGTAFGVGGCRSCGCHECRAGRRRRGVCGCRGGCGCRGDRQRRGGHGGRQRCGGHGGRAGLRSGSYCRGRGNGGRSR